MNTVSIVIPCYNHGQFLPETIASIEKARTPRLLEIIVVDDGSTDPQTHAVLEKLQKSGYDVIRQQNRGVSVARNVGIRKARGTYILPVDSDNRIRSFYLADAAALLDSDPSLGIVYGDAEYFGEKSGRWTVGDFFLSRMVLDNYIDTCALFRRTLWEDLDGYDEGMPFFGREDWDFWLRAAIRGWRFKYVPEIAFDYRVRQGSLVCEANQKAEVIERYMFSKNELAGVARIRPELYEFLDLKKSMEYRLGTRLLRPIRRLQAVLGSKRSRPGS
jgi:glycosyltransferase involved in cell wall biosynthesis